MKWMLSSQYRDYAVKTTLAAKYSEYFWQVYFNYSVIHPMIIITDIYVMYKNGRYRPG